MRERHPIFRWKAHLADSWKIILASVTGIWGNEKVPIVKNATENETALQNIYLKDVTKYIRKDYHKIWEQQCFHSTLYSPNHYSRIDPSLTVEPIFTKFKITRALYILLARLYFGHEILNKTYTKRSLSVLLYVWDI